MMLYRPQAQELAAASRKPARGRLRQMEATMIAARRFREAALPYLDDVYTLARYLLRNSADAEDAAQECYLRALRHFDTFRGAGDQAVAVRHPAQRLPQRILAPIHARL